MTKKKAELKDRLQTALDLREKKSVDLVRDLKIPKSAVSQYLSGRSQNMDSERLYRICNYLNVSEPWMLGFDVPMERMSNELEKKTDEQIEKSANNLADLFLRIEVKEDDIDLMDMLEEYMQLPEAKKEQVREYVHLLAGKV